ncbi:TonB-dependent receptor [Catenovulum sp. SM1970]|uniref:TonB-dependent receptor domain-containing protein n=1 Tax=Marinifaba aquimaris TaxID=2741323 RepID=UPI001574B310|nr:TonB-dependent receptor [Marinifaba aquimaris]NTS77765.1 TonB-dependent receptor [Marinifaba aquimaris]
MKKTTITLAAATAINAFTLSAAQATEQANNQANTENGIPLERILVTANRTQEDSFLALSSHEVITAADIERLQPQNITEILDDVAGVSVASQGGGGQSSSVFMRGTNSNHVLILVDGQRISSGTLGTANYAAISPAQIERIEVVKGPRAALWGSDAIGGVIQIFTKQYKAGEGVVSATLGSNGYWQAQAAVGLGNSDHNVTLSASVEESDGFDVQDSDAKNDDDGYDRQAFVLNANSQLTDTFALGFIANYSQGGAEYDASRADENEFENYSTKLITTYNSGYLFVEASVGRTQDHSEAFGNGQAKKDATIYETARDSASLIADYQFSEATSVSAGADWYSEDISESTSSFSEEERDTAAFFVSARHDVNNFMLEAATRYDDVDGIDSETTYNASLGYRFEDTWVVSFNHGTGFKAPSFNDLYYPEQWGYRGNQDLMPETSTTNEILIRNALDNAVLEVAIFQTDVENLISWTGQVVEGDTTWTQPVNVSEAEMKGIELTARITQEDWTYQAYVAYIKSEDAKTGDDLARRPELTANYSVSYALDAFTFDAKLSYRDDSISEYTWSTNEPVEVDSFWTLDLGVNYLITDDWNVSLRGFNVSDEDTITVTGYNDEGAAFRLSTRYQF